MTSRSMIGHLATCRAVTAASLEPERVADGVCERAAETTMASEMIGRRA